MVDVVEPLKIKPIYDGTYVWEINDSYVLKKNEGDEGKEKFEKALLINKFLRKENIPVAEYIKTISEEYSVVYDDNIYSLMRKMHGEHICALKLFADDYKSIAHHIGVEIARLHKAMKKLGNDVVYESDLMKELQSQLLDIETQNVDVPDEIIRLCLDFDNDYHSLPKQLIHRDIHIGNMLFENGRLSYFLDFDSSQVNIRLFDIVYFMQSLLFAVDNYKNDKFVLQWAEFFTFLLCGYNSENKLCEIEIKSIHRLSILMQIGFISFYLSIAIEEKKKLIPNRVNMAKWIYSNEPIFIFPLNVSET